MSLKKDGILKWVMIPRSQMKYGYLFVNMHMESRGIQNCSVFRETKIPYVSKIDVEYLGNVFLLKKLNLVFSIKQISSLPGSVVSSKISFFSSYSSYVLETQLAFIIKKCTNSHIENHIFLHS